MKSIFSSSQFDFEYNGKEYSLPITTRLAIDVEKAISTHPVTLFQRIMSANSKGDLPPVGAMTEFFVFMLKRAGVTDAKLDDIYAEMMGGEDAAAISQVIIGMLLAFIPSNEVDESDPKSKKRKSK